MSQLPTITKQTQIAASRLFAVEELQLKFSNGVERTYERLVSKGYGAVLIVAVNANNEFVLIKEYAGGMHDYVLAFPKGAIDKGETPLEAANRELQEEAGFAAKKLEVLSEVSLAPNYMGQKMTLVLAQDLYPSRLGGDEPEPLEVKLHALTAWQQLLLEPSFHEARSIAAMFLALQKLNKLGEIKC